MDGNRRWTSSVVYVWSATLPRCRKAKNSCNPRMAFEVAEEIFIFIWHGQDYWMIANTGLIGTKVRQAWPITWSVCLSHVHEESTGTNQKVLTYSEFRCHDTLRRINFNNHCGLARMTWRLSSIFDASFKAAIIIQTAGSKQVFQYHCSRLVSRSQNRNVSMISQTSYWKQVFQY